MTEGRAGWAGVEPHTQETVMEQPTRFIGMDVHKDTIVVAVTAIGNVGKATPYGTFPNTTAALEKLVKRLRQADSALRANDDETSTPREFKPEGAEGFPHPCPCYAHRMTSKRVLPP